jgi:hypothetical protein
MTTPATASATTRATTSRFGRRVPRLGALATAVVVVVVAALAGAVQAEPGRRPTSSRIAAVVVRALAYDRTLVRRAGTHADLLILSTPARVAAEAATFAPLASVGVQGLPLLVASGAPQTADDLRTLIATHHAEALYIDEITPAVAAALRDLARSTGCLVFTSTRAHLADGAHVAVVEEDGRIRLTVALPEVRAARLELAADLLKLAEVLR